MKTISIKKKIGLIIFGIFLALFLLEIGLRLQGFLISFSQEQKNKLALEKKSDYLILCLGESNTAPAHIAPPGKFIYPETFSYPGIEYNYPNQLEEILNKKSGKKVIIINEGKWAIQSSYILEHLEENLEKYNPDIVTVMMGGNEISHPWDPRFKYDNLPHEEKIFTEEKSFLENFKIYKLINLLKENIKKEKKTASSDSLKKTNNLKEKNTTEIELAKDYLKKKEYEKAEKYFKEAIEKNPNPIFSSEAYIELGSYYRKKKEYEKAEEILRKGLKEIDSNSKSNEDWLYKKNIEYKLYFNLAEGYREQENYDQAKTIVFEGIIKSHPVLYYNYQKLQEIVSGKGIPLVVIGYPTLGIEPLREVLKSDNTIIVDNEKIFKDGSYDEFFVDRFGGEFGHCTKKGNKLLAENIADAILKNSLIK